MFPNTGGGRTNFNSMMESPMIKKLKDDSQRSVD